MDLSEILAPCKIHLAVQRYLDFTCEQNAGAAGRKLSESARARIRMDAESGQFSASDLASKYGCSVVSIYHYAGKSHKLKRKIAKVTQAMYERMVALSGEPGSSTSSIAKQLEVHPDTVRRYLKQERTVR